jgi:hypothetical protein
VTFQLQEVREQVIENQIHPYEWCGVISSIVSAQQSKGAFIDIEDRHG